MATPAYWIPITPPGRLAMAPRPRGGDWLADELADWRDRGIDRLVSLRDADEVREFALGDEESLAESLRMRFWSLPIPDRGTPRSREAYTKLIRQMSDELESGRGVLVHCRQGIGRAGMLAISLLMTGGMSSEAAAARVSQARGTVVPETAIQRQFLDSFQPAVAGGYTKAGPP